MVLAKRKWHVRRSLRRLGQFLGDRLWEEDVSRLRGFRGFLYRQLRIVVVVGQSISRGQIPLWAAAMTLVTLLTLVPAIVLTFTLLRAFGGFDQFGVQLQHFILEKLVAAVQEQARLFLDQYFQGVRTFQGISLIVMFSGVLGLLSTIEEAFNHIWGIKRGRSVTQRLTTYTTIAVLGPILVGLSLTLTVSLQNTELLARLRGWPAAGGVVGLLYGVLPIVINIMGLTALYLIMPNTRVRFRSAFPSAVMAGILWEAIKWGYGLYLSSASMYRSLYGPLVAIPLLFLWIQASWMIVLFGALLTFAQEAADDFRLEEVALTASFRERLRAALRCMVSVSRAHSRGETAPSVTYLSAQLHTPVRLVRAAVGDLLGGGLLHEVVHYRDRGEGGLVPGRDLSNLTLYDVLACVQNAGTATPRRAAGPGAQEVEEALGLIDATLERLGRPMTMAGIVQTLEQRTAGPMELLHER
jgi:membrane protein